MSSYDSYVDLGETAPRAVVGTSGTGVHDDDAADGVAPLGTVSLAISTTIAKPARTKMRIGFAFRGLPSIRLNTAPDTLSESVWRRLARAKAQK
eukprot:COSAG06_NODE_15001_length_1107_cov_0.763889_1_plen_94_part_00